MVSLWLIIGLCLTATVNAMSVNTMSDKTHVEPIVNHSVPKGPLPSPKPKYDPPKGSMPSPKANHGAPRGPMPSPKPKYGAPLVPMPSPKPKHGAPKVPIASPKPNHNVPNRTHGAPDHSHGVPKGPSASPTQKQVRAFFVFGDSLVDNGNNNYLFTVARANMPPYGIDTPDHRATGRFSNGLNIPDIISEYIGSEPTLPFLSPELKGKNLLVGANFASAGVGVLNETGSHFVDVLRMPLQLEYFKEYQRRLSLVAGEKQAKELVNQALVLISVGGNDFVNNYFLQPGVLKVFEIGLPDYVTHVITEYRTILEKLYDLGARRVIVLGSGPLGCAPAERMMHSDTGECFSGLQEAAALFEPQLTKMVQDLNAKYHADVFVAANTHLMHHDMISDPKAFGFVTSTRACCDGIGMLEGLPGQCNFLSKVCPNRDEYVFWDAFHPTERACRIIVQQIMNGTHDYMYPMNLNHIMSIDRNM